MRPHRHQPTRLLHPWDSPGKNTGVGCHLLLQCMKVKRESEVAQSCPTLSDPMDCSLPGSSIHGIFQARVLECVAIAFSSTFKIQFNYHPQAHMKPLGSLQSSKLLELYYAQTVQDTILITTLQFSNQLPSPYLFFYFYSQSLFLNIILFYFILYFWLCWVFTAVCTFIQLQWAWSTLWLGYMGFLLQCLLLLQSTGSRVCRFQ